MNGNSMDRKIDRIPLEQYESVHDVVNGGFCIGCGACATREPDRLQMNLTELGTYQPKPKDDTNSASKHSLEVCPFWLNDNENQIAQRQFADQPGVQHTSETGYYLNCFAAAVSDQKQRQISSSGGIITWIAQQLLISGKVDHVACVGPDNTSDRLFAYQLIDNPAELETTRKSRYYPCEMSEILTCIRQAPGKTAFIGLPCSIKAVHLLCAQDDELSSKITYRIGLFCGHLKSMQYAAYLTRLCGLDERRLQTVNFRKPIPGKPANQYAFEATVEDDRGERTSRSIPMRNVFAGSWSYNLFMLNACHYCDDLMAETADVAIGDAWLPEFVKDGRGTSVVVCRKQNILQMLRRGEETGELAIQQLPAEKIIQSQKSGLRQRREALSYRLWLDLRRKRPFPPKRVKPDAKALSGFHRMVQHIRLQTAKISKEAFLKQRDHPGLSTFKRRLMPWVTLHYLLYLPSKLKHYCRWSRFTTKIKSMMAGD